MRKQICKKILLCIVVMGLSVFFSKLNIEAATIKHSGKCEDISWSIDSNGLLVLTGNGDYATPNDDAFETPPWCWMYGDEVTSARIQIKNITSCEEMFSGLTELKTIDLSELDTSEVLDMNSMFSECESLTSINLKYFSTQKVENMSNMFNGCSSLKTLDLSSFDVKKVISMTDMFAGCSSIEYLNLSSFDLCNFEEYWLINDDGTRGNGFHENLLLDMKKLKQIKTPKNLSFSIKLPGTATWLDDNSNSYKELPQNKAQSCTLYSVLSKGTTVSVPDWKCKVKVSSDVKDNLMVAYVKSMDKKTSVMTIPDTVKLNGISYKVTSIAANALSGNKKVTKVTVGKNVTSIGKNAFKKCAKLKTVTMKSTSLKSIGSNAFYGDKNLKTITIKSSKLTSKSVGKNAFKGTNKKLTIKVPKKKVSSYKKFLKRKGNAKVTIKKG